MVNTLELTKPKQPQKNAGRRIHPAFFCGYYLIDKQTDLAIHL